MDEPTKSLDPIAAQELRKFIKEELVYKYKKTIFFTTHNLEEAEYLADRLAIMDKGQIRALGTMDKLRQMMGNTNADMKAILSISHVFPTQVRPVLSPTSVSVWLPLSALINATLVSTLVSSTTQAHCKYLYRRGGETPFLPVLTLGFVVALAIGDPFTTVVKHLLSIP